MKNSSNKVLSHTVLISILSMLVCMTIFVGSTFAWFSDSINSKNKIEAGKLTFDVQVLKEGSYSSIYGREEALFNSDLWEPNYVQAVNVKVINTGTLALKYELQIGADGTLNALLANETMLSDVIDVYYADKEVVVTNQEELEAAVAQGKIFYRGTLTQVFLAGTLIQDVLLPKNAKEDKDYTTDYATIALKMQSEVSFDYQDRSVEPFDLKLTASQFAYEKDSFSENYDLQLQSGLIFDDGKTHTVNESITFRDANTHTDVITAIGEGTVVNITGGYYDAVGKDCAVWAKDGAVVNIYGGAFFCDGLGEEATSANHQDLIYAGANGGTINVYGGLFSARTAGAWLLNEKDGQGTINLYGGTFVDWNPADNASEHAATNFLKADYCLLTSYKGTATYYSVLPADNALKHFENGDIEILGNVTMMDVPLFRDATREEGYTVNGNGYTVDFHPFPGHEFVNIGWYPEDTTLFTTKNGDLVTVNDITFTGEGSYILAGDYVNKRSNTQTVLNNVNIIDFKSVQLNKWCTAFNACGKVWLNNCTITGTTRSEFSTFYDASVPFVLSMVVSNGSETFIDGGRYDSIYLDNSAMCEIRGATIDTIYTEAWGQTNDYVLVGQDAYVKKIEARFERSRIKIEDNAVVEVLDLTKVRKAYRDRIKVASTATVGKIVVGDKEYATLQEWYNSFA
ncbi:MAG: hypothetical protein II368_01675 [Clostridia bacterium]|nr:hypothetical protein [Clostridia bacterium]